MPRTPQRQHGGRREGSGRKAIFPGKNPQPVSILLTDEARRELDAACAALGASRNDIVEALIRGHARTLQLAPIVTETIDGRK